MTDLSRVAWKRKDWLKAGNFPVRYYGQALADLDDVDDSTTEPLMAWREQALLGALTNPSMASPMSGKGLVLWGDPGTGKTVTACALLTDLVLYGDPELVWGHTSLSDTRKNRVVYFCEFDEVLENRKRLFSLDETSEDYWRCLRDDQSVSGHAGTAWNATVLVLDDLGKEHTTKSRWAEDSFDSLLRHRYNLGFPTIITTNVDPERWGQVYNDSMGSFASEALISVPMTGPDRRVS